MRRDSYHCAQIAKCVQRLLNARRDIHHCADIAKFAQR